VWAGEPTWQEQLNLPEWTTPVLAEQAVIILGAGRTMGNGGADFSWLDAWSVAATSAVQPSATADKASMLRVAARRSGIFA
jgi:hypothetical protein